MLAITRAISLLGLTGHLIDVEADIGNGVPGFTLLGLPMHRSLNLAIEFVLQSPTRGRSGPISGLPSRSHRRRYLNGVRPSIVQSH